MVLSTAIEELPADYRAVVVLRDVEGFSHREIAESLGLTVVNVKMRVHRARLFLRKRLAAHFSLAGVESMSSVAGSIGLEMRAPAPRDLRRSSSPMRPASLATSSRDLRRACAI